MSVVRSDFPRIEQLISGGSPEEFYLSVITLLVWLTQISEHVVVRTDFVFLYPEGMRLRLPRLYVYSDVITVYPSTEVVSLVSSQIDARIDLKIGVQSKSKLAKSTNEIPVLRIDSPVIAIFVSV